MNENANGNYQGNGGFNNQPGNNGMQNYNYTGELYSNNTGELYPNYTGELNSNYNYQSNAYSQNPNYNMASNNYNMRPQQNVPKKNSGLGIAALVLSILGCTFIIGAILAIIDLAKNDGKKKTLSIVSLGICGFWLIVGIVSMIVKPSDEKDSSYKPLTEASTEEADNNSDNTDNKTDEKDTQSTEDATESTTEAAKAGSDDTTIEEQVLVDQDGVKITALEYVHDTIWGDGIKLLIENNTDQDITVGCTALIVNDYMISDLFVQDVAAGKKANEMMDLSSSELREAGIENVGKIEIYFHAYDSDTWDDIMKSDVVTIKTSNYDNMDTTPNDVGVELYNDNGVRIVGKAVDENSFWGTAVLLYIENNSGRNIMVQCEDLSINGFTVNEIFSADIYDGKKIIDDIDILSSELEENGIESVEEIELKFNIIDNDTYDTIVQTDIITIRP